MAKTVSINTCLSCPYLATEFNWFWQPQRRYCANFVQLHPNYQIPYNCPLPDSALPETGKPKEEATCAKD